jgi:hypothetical protein
MLDLLLFLTLVPFALGEEIPVFDEPYAPIFFDKPVYSWTDKVNIKIIAPSWNSNNNKIDSIGDSDSHSIKISSRNHSLNNYKFTETDVSSGVFTGEIILTGFHHDVNGDGFIDTNPSTRGNGPTGGFLETERDSSISISFEFADGVVLVESAPISWNKGNIEFTKKNYLFDEIIEIEIIDSDMNLNPESIDRVSFTVFSDSDLGGLILDALETSEDSGRFYYKIQLSENFSTGNQLHAKIGDQIYVKYVDYTLPSPFSISEHMEITDTAMIENPITSLNRINSSNVNFTDRLGYPLTSIFANQHVQIVGEIQNNQKFNQNFIYIFQIKNSFNYVESVSWVQGELTGFQKLNLSQTWIPSGSGTYQIESFVWNSFSEPSPLSNSTKIFILVE